MANKKAEDGMLLPIREALVGLDDASGNPIQFEVTKNFSENIATAEPSYFYEDKESGKQYTLSFEPPQGLVTVRVANIPLTESEQKATKQSETRESKGQAQEPSKTTAATAAANDSPKTTKAKEEESIKETDSKKSSKK